MTFDTPLSEAISEIKSYLKGSPNGQALWDILTALRGPDNPTEREGMPADQWNEQYSLRRARKRETVEVIRGKTFPNCGEARCREDIDYVTLPPKTEWDHFDKHVARAANWLGLKIETKAKPKPGVKLEVAKPDDPCYDGSQSPSGFVGWGKKPKKKAKSISYDSLYKDLLDDIGKETKKASGWESFKTPYGESLKDVKYPNTPDEKLTYSWTSPEQNWKNVIWAFKQYPNSYNALSSTMTAALKPNYSAQITPLWWSVDSKKANDSKPDLYRVKVYQVMTEPMLEGMLYETNYLGAFTLLKSELGNYNWEQLGGVVTESIKNLVNYHLQKKAGTPGKEAKGSTL